MSRPEQIGDLLSGASAALEVASTRHPVERTGPREPIPDIVRLLVLKRDRFRCDWCLGADLPGQPFHLDHIVPWSAGGSDDTTNLRLLHPECNEGRSNYRTDASYTRRIACTSMCMPCAGWDVTLDDFEPDETERVFCGYCNRVSWIAFPQQRWGCRKY